MKKDNDIELLSDKSLDINEVYRIYKEYRGDIDSDSNVAMNLSLRTSVVDREKEGSETMTKLLVELSDSPSMEARWAVAKNPHTPLEIILKLADDEINLVRALVATNPITPTEVLEKFFDDEKIVRDGLSGNPNTSPKLLRTLSDDTDKLVRMRIADNPSTPKFVLEKLLEDKESNVSKAAEVNLRRFEESNNA